MAFTLAQRNALISDLISDIDQVRLHVGDPGANGTASLVTGGGYSNQALSAANWTPDTSDGTAELGEVDFGTASAAWGTVSWYSLWDGGSFRARREFTTARPIANGAAVTITANTITLSVTSTD